MGVSISMLAQLPYRKNGSGANKGRFWPFSATASRTLPDWRPYI